MNKASKRWALIAFTCSICTILSTLFPLEEVVGPSGALAELFRIKEEGLADAVGLAAGNVNMMMTMLRNWDFDAVMTHNRFTLANRSATPMIELAMEKGIAVLNAAPYAGGVLAKGSRSFPRYVYQEASPEFLGPIHRIEAIQRRGLVLRTLRESPGPFRAWRSAALAANDTERVRR